MFSYLANHNWWTSRAEKQAAIDYAYGLATKYGEAAGAAVCEFYDEVAEEWAGRTVAPAVPAKTATYGEVAKTINGTGKTLNTKMMSDAVGRLVKMAGVDTMLQNALRDGAEWAWIPRGDTCPFCLTLASRGWQEASEKAIKNGHAEHIHSHCDCTYAVRFSPDQNVEGYNPEEYRELYYSAEGNTPEEKINSMRRIKYGMDKDRINAQKRVAYAKRQGITAYEGVPKSWNSIGKQSTDQAMKGSNPNYKKNIPVSLYGSKEDYTNNCANSVVAFEMRRRGYDVTACSLGDNKKLKKDPFSAWIGRKPNKTTGTGLEEIFDYMKEADDGTRIEIAIRYKNQTKGHTFISEKNGEDILLLDPQRNIILDESIFTKAEENATLFMRIDDLEISDRGVTACKKVK